MIKRELRADPALATENWDRFLPHFKKRTLAKRKKPLKVVDKSRKVYTPFPPPREKSKVDLQIESGEYFLGRQAKERREREEREERQRGRAEERRREREVGFVPPKEREVDREGEGKKKRKKREGEDAGEGKKKKKKRKRVEEGEIDGGVGEA